MKRLLTICGVLALCSGCLHPPAYQRPVVNVPDTYRGAPAATTDAASLADQKWFEVFKDEQLQALIRKAIADNYDVKIAAIRVVQAEEQVTIARADQFPTLSGGVGGSA